MSWDLREALGLFTEEDRVGLGRDLHLVNLLSLMERAGKEEPDQQGGGPGPAGFTQVLGARAGYGDQQHSISSKGATLEWQDEKSVRIALTASWKR